MQEFFRIPQPLMFGVRVAFLRGKRPVQKNGPVAHDGADQEPWGAPKEP